MLSRSAQNWNQEFTFDGELAEISGVQNQGIPLFLFFLWSTLAVYIGVIHLFRALTHACSRTQSKRGRGKQGERGRNSISSSSWRLSWRYFALYCYSYQIHIRIYIYISITFLLNFDNFLIPLNNFIIIVN